MQTDRACAGSFNGRGDFALLQWHDFQQTVWVASHYQRLSFCLTRLTRLRTTYRARTKGGAPASSLQCTLTHEKADFSEGGASVLLSVSTTVRTGGTAVACMSALRSVLLSPGRCFCVFEIADHGCKLCLAGLFAVPPVPPRTHCLYSLP